MKKLFCVLPLLLAGCASEQAIQDRYYILANNSTAIEAKLSAPMLVVQTQLPDYLSSKGLVYRTSATQIVEAQHSLWAQDIKQQLTQRIVSDLQRKQDDYWPIQANSVVDFNGKKQLLVSLQHFNGVYTGVAEITGEWLLIDGEGKVLANKHFQLQVPLQRDGYDALLDSLSRGVDQLTDLLAKQLY